MIDPIISLAFSIHSNPGVYVLLLGSGVSRSAGIPTGWEVTLDLIRKLAHLYSEDCEPDPAVWYKNKFRKEPDYGKLLEAIAKSPTERSQLLRSYFEPTEEQREQGLKIPKEVHKAIAEMVANGQIRVILTTNFDRLLETALDTAGVIPTVISTPDATEGAYPLTHTKCTIIKLNGDYLDSRIKNTPRELALYDKRLNRLLDRVFDEFGLIVCGWSAEWDTGLRSALERCKNHRFTAYWSVKSKPRDVAQNLINLRQAQVIKNHDADFLFQELAEKVSALSKFDKPHPLSTKTAVITLKTYLMDDRYKIRLHDLVMQETEKVYVELSDQNFPTRGNFSKEELLSRVQRYEALTEILMALLITGCYWGEKKHEDLWTKCLQRIANPSGERSDLDVVWLKLKLYPALLLLYSGGIASIGAGRYGNLSALLAQAQVQSWNENKAYPMVLRVCTREVMDKNVGQQLPGMGRSDVPVSDYLYSLLRDPLRGYLPDDAGYKKCFDRFEYLLGLVHTDLRTKEGHDIWGPIGCFGWRYLRREGGIMKEIGLEAEKAGSAWSPLKAGLFDGSFERFKEVKSTFDQFIGKACQGWW
jgi:hypothetical protein